MEILFIILSGVAAGVIGGMGMGGGTVLIPMLTIFFDINQHAAQAVNLTAFIPMSIAAIIIHAKNKLIDYRLALIIILPAAAAAAGGSLLAKNTESGMLQKLFGVFLALLAVLQVVMIIIDNKKSGNKKQTFARERQLIAKRHGVYRLCVNGGKAMRMLSKQR